MNASLREHPRVEPLQKRVLVVDPDPRHRAWLSRIVRSVVASVNVCADLSEGPDPFDHDLVVIHRDGLDNQKVFDLLAAMRDAAGRTQPLLISSAGRGYLDVFEELHAYGLMNLLAKNQEVNAIELIVTIQKILRKDVFGLDKYFSWGVPTLSRLVRSSTERPAVIEEAEAYARDLAIAPRLFDRFCVVVDELLTNALYNAPRGADGAPRFAHLPRTVPVTMDPGEEVTVSLSCDAYHLGVSVVDRFGSLDSEACVGHLARCFRKDEDQVSAEQGGAGLGLYFSFDSLSQFIVNVARNHQTEVIGLISIHGSYREFARLSKSFNIFVAPAPKAA